MAEYEEIVLKSLKLHWPSLYNCMVDHVVTKGGRLLVVDDHFKAYIYSNDGSIRQIHKKNEMPNIEYAKSEFGYNFVDLMYCYGLTQKDISEKTGISEHTISKYANGSGLPSVYNAILMAKVIGCELDEFIDEKWYEFGEKINKFGESVMSAESEEVCRDIFSRNLLALMDNKMISKQHLAYSTGLSMQVLGKYMAGKSLPTYYNLNKIANALKCKPSSLLPICK